MKAFISHSSKDKKFVVRLANDLSGRGIDVWLDQWEIQPGDKFVEKLTEVGCYVFDTIKRADYSTVKLFPPLLSTRAGLDEALFCIDYSLQEAGK